VADLTVPDDAIALLRPIFVEIEGDCEAWTDDDIVRKVFVRGAMDYAKAAGRPWGEVSGLASQLRRAIT
jgi:hypothetical protein